MIAKKFGLLLQGRHKRPSPGVSFADLSCVGLMTEIKRLVGQSDGRGGSANVRYG